MAVLQPEFAVLDETDSGLDIDALRIVAEGVNAQLNPELGVLLITHYQRLLNYIKPDVVHVLAQGRIIKPGGRDLALRAGGGRLRPHPAGGRVRGSPRTDERRADEEAGRTTLRSHAMRATAARPAARIRADFPLFERDFGGGRRWPTSTAPPPRSSRRSSSTRSRLQHAATPPTSTGASTPRRRRRPPPTRRPRRRGALHRRCRSAHEIVFVRNATEAINLVAYSWGRRNIRPRRHHRAHRARAPLQPGALAAAGPGEGRGPGVRGHRRRGPARPAELRGAAAHPAQAGRLQPRLEWPGHHQSRCAR